MKQTNKPANSGLTYYLGASTIGMRTREALKTAQGKKKGGKVARVQSMIDGQICRISNKIERANNQRNSRRAKRK